MRAGTGEQGVFEHVDSRAELLPEGGPPQGIHLYTSKCHAAHNSRQVLTFQGKIGARFQVIY